MPVHIQQISAGALQLYASVPISFTVRSRLRVDPVDSGLGGLRLVEEPVDPPYLKDYDADESPLLWAERFDVRRWAFFLAFSSKNRPVGAAAVAFNTPGVNMLEGRTDLAVLWDIRVHPEARGKGIGAALFEIVQDWSKAQGCRELKVETQNINVSACRFYARMGCTLGAVQTHAYHGTLAHEVMLLWYKTI